MEVTNLGQFQQLSEQGYHFTVKDDGKIYTQSFFSRQIQHIKDAFSSIRPGKAAELRYRTGMLRELKAATRNLAPQEGPSLSMSTLPTEAPKKTFTAGTSIAEFFADSNIKSNLEVHRGLTKDNIKRGMILKQGMNTCFMYSVLNAMLTTDRGVEILKNRVTEDGRLTSPKSGEPAPRERGLLSPMLNDFEGSCISANNEAVRQGDPGDIVSEGRQGTMGWWALATFPELYAGYGIKIDQPEEGIIKEIRDSLQAGKMVIYFEPSSRATGGHYMAVVGTTDDNQIIVRDSLNGKEYPTKIKLDGKRQPVMKILQFDEPEE